MILLPHYRVCAPAVLAEALKKVEDLKEEVEALEEQHQEEQEEHKRMSLELREARDAGTEAALLSEKLARDARQAKVPCTCPRW